MDSIGWQSKNKSEKLRYIGLSLIFLFYFSAFISKFVMDLTLILSFTVSICYAYLYDKNQLKKNKFLVYFIILLLFGLILSFFSKAGFAGGFKFAGRFRFMLIIFPLAIFIKTYEELRYIYFGLIISAVISIIYGVFIIYGKTDIFTFLRGFQKIGRTADMLMVLILTNIVYLFYSDLKEFLKTIKLNGFILSVTLFYIWALIMTAIRGAWLGLCCGLIIFGVFFRQKFLVFILIAGACILISLHFLHNPILSEITEQVQSIVKINSNESELSNNTRTQLWKVGFDFAEKQFLFGTGAKNTRKMFKKFFRSKPLEYRKKYHYAGDHSRDFHNSFLQILIETGIVFFIFYLCFFGYLIFKLFSALNKAEPFDKKIIIAAITATLGFFISQFVHSDLYSYGSSVWYLVLFAGLFTANKYEVF